MKKTIAIITLASTIGLTGLYQASAYKGMGAGDMGGSGGCNGAGRMMHHKLSQMDEVSKEKFDAFFKDTQQLRRSIVIKRAEKKALMKNGSPDAKKIGKLAGEIFDLRMSMQEKAEAAGLHDLMQMDCGCGQSDGLGSHHGRKSMMKRKDMNNGQEPSVN
jgi:Spy/CpxP family protein refolding chaperone